MQILAVRINKRHAAGMELIAAGHQPAADHILERFEIFGSMVPWFNQSVTPALCSQRFG